MKTLLYLLALAQIKCKYRENVFLPKLSMMSIHDDSLIEMLGLLEYISLSEFTKSAKKLI